MFNLGKQPNIQKAEIINISKQKEINMKLSSILGLNARTQLFSYRFNTRKGKKIADSKIQTWRVLKKSAVATPKIIKKFKTPSDVFSYDWGKLPDAFALKPSRGLGGEGIVVIKKRAEEYELNPRTGRKKLVPQRVKWVTTQKEKITDDDLKLHVLDILEGAYSMRSEPDVAFVQEYIGRHKVFRKLAYRGTPDIRIIVFRKVPIVAMLRLPTKESKGRANLHQGAVGVGIDIATGITTRAVWHQDYIRRKPGSNKKLHGIKIPQWNNVLMTAVNAQIASGLTYVGVDIVLHPEKGPMVIEINAQPGLQIQLANKVGLRRRLDKIEDLEVINAEHGVRIARALFSEKFAERVKTEDITKTINVWELIKIVDVKKKKHEIPVKVDTGAWRTSIDADYAQSLGLTYPENIIAQKKVRNQMGKGVRKMINIVYYLSGKRIKSVASLAKRGEMRVKMIVGRRDLTGFLVKADEGEVAKYDWYKALWTRKRF